jgi:hypothetical protein
MQCFDPDIDLNPDGDLGLPQQVECRCCGVPVRNGEQRATHQAFHDRVDSDAPEV